MLAAALAPLLAAIALAAFPLAPASAARRTANPKLWATVNVCDPAGRPGAVGVRVSIPGERRSPHQWARIRVQFFDAAARRWKLVRIGGDSGWARLGGGSGLVQGGTTFTFAVPARGQRLLLRGLVDVQWRRGTRIVDRARLRTTAGHADPSDPALGVSRARCAIRR
jgi:hypothetical protein